jgi:Ni,Fe-hydrogenase III component G
VARSGRKSDRLLADAFRQAVTDLKAKGARLVTLSSTPEASGETTLNYFFDVDGQLTPLSTRTQQRCIESLYSVFAGADVVEREVNSLFGVKFLGNPNLPNLP